MPSDFVGITVFVIPRRRLGTRSKRGSNLCRSFGVLCMWRSVSERLGNRSDDSVRGDDVDHGIREVVHLRRERGVERS